jgi:hypothetical protein
MAQQIPKPKRDMNQLSDNVHAFIKNRNEKAEVYKQDNKTIADKNNLAIYQIIKELETMLAELPKNNPKVLAIRHKLLDLKLVFYNTLDIK